MVIKKRNVNLNTDPIDPNPTPDPVEPEDPNPDPKSFDYTGSEQTYTVPKTGKYKLEVWGAQGATDTTDKMGGLGGYSRGTISLQKNQKIYIFVGGKGQNINSGSQTGTIRSYPNGGAITVKSKDNYSITYSSGGSSTHIASENKLISDLSSNLQALYIASGGSGGGGYYGGGASWGGSAGGGSGYIGNSLLTNKVMYCYNCLESSTENTKTISTTCKSSSPQENCAKEGNGYAIISYVE